MRKFWIVSAAVFAVGFALAAGVWIGVVYGDPLAHTLRAPAEKDHSVALDGKPIPQTQAASAKPAATGKTLYHCGMHPWIIQDHPGTCPICHMELTPIRGGSAQVATAERKILYYWDPNIGPSSISATPGTSSAGMALLPVYADQVSGGPAISIDPTVVQNMGVQTAVVKKAALTKSLRTVGYLEVPETGLHDVTIKVNGYINKLYADTTGMHLHKGEPLFDLYSPELVAAEDELIAARKSLDALAAASDDVKRQARSLLESARRKLELLDVSDADINAVAKEDHAPRTITVRSPAEGHLEEKAIVQGSAVQAGTKLMRIEDHRKMWLEAQVYEEQLPLVALGETADASFDALPGQTFSGKITFINPHLDHMLRTIAVRIELDNSEFKLKPGMYATVRIHAQPVENALVVPREAVIDTGTRKIAFVQEAEGHFAPRLVTTGLSGDNDEVQILTGLAPGEMVVTSGQFLMDVESRTQEAIEKLQMSASVPPAATMPMAETTTATAPTSAPAKVAGRTDEAIRAYLAVAAVLQGNGTKPADVSALQRAADQLTAKVPTDEQPLAKTLQAAVLAMKDQPLEQQRKRFEKVGAAIVPLIDKDPPSSAVGPTLYVVNCPMENADWLQTETGVHNPFLPSMRSCGSITRTLSLRPLK